MAESKFKEQKIDTRVSIDRLSNLPDVLQLKILSYLPIKQAVATSILSNTWRSLYLSRPSLHFDDGTNALYIRSSQFLQENYSHLADSEDFALNRNTSCTNPTNDVTRWIEITIQRQVEILDVSPLISVSLPSSVFTCSTIVVLRLNRVILNDCDCDSVCMPSLKILHLKSVTFGSLETIEKLLGSTMILEDLALNNINIPLPSSILTCSSIMVLRLNNVTLNHSDSDCDFDCDCDPVCLPSLKILHLKSVTFGSLGTINKLLLCNMMILEDLALKNISISCHSGVVSCNHSCKSFPKLIRAQIESSIFIPLDSVHNVESLKVPTLYYWPYGQFRYQDSRTFRNMISMEVKFYDCRWRFVDNMLQYTPKLQNLVICKKLEGYFSSWIKDPKPVPECLSSHLRTCYVKGFDSEKGAACVLPFAKYVVENGRVLETMTISCSNPITKNLINEELLSWHRSSPACQVKIQ